MELCLGHFKFLWSIYNFLLVNTLIKFLLVGLQSLCHTHKERSFTGITSFIKTLIASPFRPFKGNHSSSSWHVFYYYIFSFHCIYFYFFPFRLPMTLFMIKSCLVVSTSFPKVLPNRQIRCISIWIMTVRSSYN